MCDEVLNILKNLSYAEWIRIKNGVDRAFEEKERSARKQLKADAERIEYFVDNL